MSTEPNVIAGPAGQEFQRLDPRVRMIWMLGSVIGAIVLAGVAMLIEMATLRGQQWWPLPVPLMGLLVGVLVLLASVWWSLAAYPRFGFLLTERELIVRSGVVFQSRRFVPRVRIQHVAIDSGPIDRGFGLCEVSIYVAGSMGPVAQIPGLSPQVAEQLKEALVVADADGV
jgi:uncharacterized protein